MTYKKIINCNKDVDLKNWANFYTKQKNIAKTNKTYCEQCGGNEKRGIVIRNVGLLVYINFNVI